MKLDALQSIPTPFLLIGIAVIVLLIFFIVYAFVRNHSIKKEYEQLIDMKNDILNQSISSELETMQAIAKTAESQKMLDIWELEYRRITNEEIPSIELELEQIEVQRKKRRFRDADFRVDRVEVSLDKVLKECQTLVDAIGNFNQFQEDNKTLISRLREQYEVAQYSYKSNLHLLFHMQKPLEERFSVVAHDFKGLDDYMTQGEYSKARGLAEETEYKVTEIVRMLNTIPHIFENTKIEFPAQLKQLRDKENRAIEYKIPLNHLLLDDHFRDIERAMEQLNERVTALEFDHVEEDNKQIESHLQKINEDIDHEFEAYDMIAMVYPQLQENVSKLVYLNSLAEQETERLRHRYLLDEERLSLNSNVVARLSKLEEDVRMFTSRIQDRNEMYSDYEGEVERLVEEQEYIDTSLKEYVSYLELLQEEEESYILRYKTCKEQMERITNYVSRQNIPGFTEKMQADYYEIIEQLDILEKELSNAQVNLTEVERITDNVEYLISEKFVEDIEKMVRNAHVAERMLKEGYKTLLRTDDSEVEEKVTSAETNYGRRRYVQSIEQVMFVLGREDQSHAKEVLRNIMEETKESMESITL